MLRMIEILTDVILRDDEKTDVVVRVQTTSTHSDVGSLFAKEISEKIMKETGFSNTVKVMILPSA